jgi:hypothetical protein
MAEDRANNTARQPKFPEVPDIQQALQDGKITLEEGYHLAGSDPDTAHDRGEHPLGEDYRIHVKGTPFGDKERSRKVARLVHGTKGRKGY